MCQVNGAVTGVQLQNGDKVTCTVNDPNAGLFTSDANTGSVSITPNTNNSVGVWICTFPGGNGLPPVNMDQNNQSLLTVLVKRPNDNNKNIVPPAALFVQVTD
jgi:hypothetical protein